MSWGNKLSFDSVSSVNSLNFFKHECTMQRKARMMTPINLKTDLSGGRIRPKASATSWPAQVSNPIVEGNITCNLWACTTFAAILMFLVAPTGGSVEITRSKLLFVAPGGYHLQLLRFSRLLAEVPSWVHYEVALGVAAQGSGSKQT